MLNTQKIKINYCFFALWFLLLVVFSLFHLNSFENSKILFLLHSFFQGVVEVMVALILAHFIKEKTPSLIFKIITASFFLFLLGRFIHFIMLNLMDSSIFYALSMIFGNGIKEIFTNLKAADISINVVISLSLTIILLPFIGYYFYLLSEKLSSKKPCFISYKTTLKCFISFFILALLCDIASSLNLSSSYLSTYRKRLPCTVSLMPLKRKKIIFEDFALSLKKEDETTQKIKNKNIKTEKNHNIFLFVIESFRKDFITPSIAPCLSKFKEENICLKYSFSAANGTHPSWFALFYSLFPVNWTYYKDNWQNGATTLKIMKELNYKINVLSSADLNYFQMNKTLFGKNFQLLDSYSYFEDKKAWYRDEKAFKSLKEQIKENSSKKNNLFIVFLDSTHSEYNCPDNFKIKFFPISNNINYLKLACSSKINLFSLKNRYFNAINYLDSLFKDFFEHLKTSGLYEDSIVVITADHGEEFYENGSLFHGTHLNKYQINIPIFYKLPGKIQASLKDQNELTSIIDIFPTIFQEIAPKASFKDLLEGQSIFTPNKKQRCLCAEQNGAKNPCKFAVFKEDKKMIVNHLSKNTFEIISTDELKENSLE